jgi:large subunit ribosomal protein L31
MKATGHPQYYEAVVKCACGNTFTVGSTKQAIMVDICAKCHPFFTGEMRFVDTMGRVERFSQKMQNRPTGPVTKKAKKLLKQKLEQEEEARRPKSLKEMFDKVKTG